MHSVGAQVNGSQAQIQNKHEAGSHGVQTCLMLVL